MKKLLVTAEDAMNIIGVGRTMLYALLAEGKIESVTIGRRRLFKYASLEKLTEGNTEINTQDAYARLKEAKATK